MQNLASSCLPNHSKSETPSSEKVLHQGGGRIALGKIRRLFFGSPPVFSPPARFFFFFSPSSFFLSPSRWRCPQKKNKISRRLLDNTSLSYIQLSYLTKPHFLTRNFSFAFFIEDILPPPHPPHSVYGVHLILICSSQPSPPPFFLDPSLVFF